MTTIAYGARCSWWDDKRNVASMDGTPTGLPCCPHCRGVLMEIDEADWWAQAAEYDSPNLGYSAFLRWARGRCYPTVAESQTAYYISRLADIDDLFGPDPANITNVEMAIRHHVRETLGRECARGCLICEMEQS